MESKKKKPNLKTLLRQMLDDKERLNAAREKNPNIFLVKNVKIIDAIPLSPPG